MGELWNLVPADGVRRFVFDAAWQSTLVCLLVWSLAQTVRRKPALRAAVLLAGSLLCVITPTVSSVVRYGGWGVLTPAELTEAAEEIGWVYEVPSGKPRPVILDSASAVREAGAVSPERADWQSWGWLGFSCAWGVASGVLAVRLARSAFAVRRACRIGEICNDGSILSALGRAAHAMGVPAPIVKFSTEVDSPALASPGLGMWGDTLLLPAAGDERGDWYAIFCHELAHMARRDGWSRLAVEIVGVVLPWQPLSWLVRRDFRAACEEACDDWAIAAGADPVEFASILLDFVPQARPALMLGMAESAPAARARIMRLLAMQGMPRPSLGPFLGILGWVIAIALAVLLALLQSGRPLWRGSDLPPWGNTPINMAAAFNKEPPSDRPPLKPYVVDTPDVLLIDAVKVVPKPPYHIEPLDTLELFVLGTLPDQNIAGPYPVEADGTIALGPSYGIIKVGGLTLVEARDAIKEQLEGDLTAPEVSVSLSESAGKQQIAGEHLIGPDGTVNLGSYGSIFVVGMTVPEVRKAIENHLMQFLDNPQISVDVHAYNSKFYFVVSERDGMDYVLRVPCTGRERVLDALSHDGNLRLSPTGWVWISRPGVDNAQPTILPVDWRALLRGESNLTNYWIEPGDRVFVQEK